MPSQIPRDMRSSAPAAYKTKTEQLVKVLRRFGFEDIAQHEQPERPPGAQNIYLINTGSGKFALKEYKEFDYARRKSLELLNYLGQHGYPCPIVFSTDKGRQYVKHGESHFALFEYLEFVENPVITEARAYETGRYLAILHNLAQEFRFMRRDKGHDYFKGKLVEDYEKRIHAPGPVRKQIEFMMANIDRIRFPSKLPESVCHVEFVRKHLMFDNEGAALKKVIDWDFISRDITFYDLGTTTTIAFTPSLGISFPRLARLIEGYDSERKLTDWELSHIYEAVLYGSFKYAIWDISEMAWGSGTFGRVGSVMTYNRNDFELELHRYLRSV